MVAIYADPFEVDLPGELTPHEVIDYTPNIGGCGQALVVVAVALIGDVDQAQTHLDHCPPCREAVATVGDLARSSTALAFFAGKQTPHTAELATAAV